MNNTIILNFDAYYILSPQRTKYVLLYTSVTTQSAILISDESAFSARCGTSSLYCSPLAFTLVESDVLLAADPLPY